MYFSTSRSAGPVYAVNYAPIVDSSSWCITHWGRVTHICVGKLTIIGSDNGLSPRRRQAFIWTNAGILLIGPIGTEFSEILTEIHTFSFTKMHLKMSSVEWRPFCLGLNVIINFIRCISYGSGGDACKKDVFLMDSMAYVHIGSSQCGDCTTFNKSVKDAYSLLARNDKAVCCHCAVLVTVYSIFQT